ncbi:coiled-coil-helix-coiled-coil-helix domain-containing protein 1 [Hermetia illucens]|uniref:coiled-coil-helix-coiled-coil-helix domain-containing protein 1 n=1 Tax=Hermetia illucens TaxID=343691 RepID=UPI0018CC27C7|nr:coiled-coil-helix-coiled-coil-helix domain-containing protein 1 [Hermetia illucens]
MRFASALLANARAPQRESIVPFQEILPLRLKNRVSGKADSQTEVACLQEMTILFTCLKENDFQESLCSKEVQTFNKCYKTFMDTSFQAKKVDSQGAVKPGKDLNYKQLNKYMRRYPNP